MSLRSSIQGLIPVGLAMAWVVLGCTGPQRHPELTDDPSVLMRRWTLQTHGPFQAGDHGTEFSNPVVLENNLVFGNQSVGLVSIYPLMNLQRWVLPIPGGVISELTVSQNSVFFGGGDGYVYSVDLETGQVNWRYEIKNPIVSRPTIASGRLLVSSSDNTVWAFDVGTGKWLWHYRRRTSQLSTILGASAPVVDGGEVLAGTTDGYLVALSLEEGQLKWEKKIHSGTKFTDVDAHPVLEDNVIYIPSYDGALYALKRQNGEALWRFDAGGSKDVVIDQDRIYLPSSDGTLYCLQKSNAKVLWKFDLDGGVPTRLAVTEDAVILGSSYQYLYVVDKRTGKGVYRFNAGNGSGFYGSPAYQNSSNRLYILSGAGNLYSFLVRKISKKLPVQNTQNTAIPSG